MTDITRRDFLNGVALTIAAGLTPMAQLNAQTRRRPGAIRPRSPACAASTKARLEVGHELRDRKPFPLGGTPIEERYDLVVVGGGISGLAAAWFYRRADRHARILVLDNHDDFGGHAKRNEFHIDGRLIIGYGGSESMQSPKGLYSDVAKGLLKELGVDIARFETAFERTLYPSLGLSRGVFFPRETFGRDALVTGDPTATVADDLGKSLLNARPLREFIAQFPISTASKAQLIGLYEQTRDPLAGKTRRQKTETLEQMSYRDYLLEICKCSKEVADCFQGRTLDFFALGCDAVPASDARDAGYPGFAGLALPPVVSPERSEPYIYHFPDGNASLARLLVRALIPAAAPGTHHGRRGAGAVRLRQARRRGIAVRIRLDSTCVNVRNVADGVSSPICATASSIAWRRSTRCSPASTASFLTSCRSCRGRSARRWRRT